MIIESIIFAVLVTACVIVFFSLAYFLSLFDEDDIKIIGHSIEVIDND